MRKGEKRIVFLYILYLFCLFSNPAPCAPSSQNTLPPSLLLLLLVCGRCRFKNRKMIDFFCLLLLKLNNFRRQNFQVFFFKWRSCALNESVSKSGARWFRGVSFYRRFGRESTTWDGFGARDFMFVVVVSTKSVFLRCLTVACFFLEFQFFFQLSNSFLTSSFLFNCKYHPNYNNISN